MSQPAGTSAKPRRRLARRVLYWSLGPLLALLLFVVVGWLIIRHTGVSRLERARAEADRLDPGWRWEELQAKRPRYADSENSGVTVANVIALLPASWDSALNVTPQPAEGSDITPPSISGRMYALAFNEHLEEDMLAALRQSLANAKGAFAEAHKLANQPRGRLLLSNDPTVGISSPRISEPRQVCTLFGYESLVRAHDGDLDGALVANRCSLNTAGSIGDEPGLFPHLTRFAIELTSVTNLQRILGQGQASAAEAEKLQEAYEHHLAEPVLLTSLRGERAMMDETGYLMRAVATNPLLKAVGWYDHNCGAVLEFMNRSVEIAKLPVAEQRDEFVELDREVQGLVIRSSLTSSGDIWVRLLSGATLKFRTAGFRRQSMIGCAVLALAAERYRLQHGTWPEKIEDLEPLVKSIPVDPFGKGSIKMKRAADGLIFYSVGPDGEDNGGNLDRTKPNAKGVDLGFQLWDVEKRRQPAASGLARP